MRKLFFYGVLFIVAAWALSYRPDIPLDKLLDRYADEDSHFLKIGESQIHVRIKGEGEPIFLIHGSFSSSHTWEEWEHELSKYFMTIAMDLPGHGLTGPDPLARYTVEDYAEIVFGIADQIGIDEFHLAGHSLGGEIALQMGMVSPKRILSLNLINATIPQMIGEDNRGDSEKGKFHLMNTPVLNRLLLKCTPMFLIRRHLEQAYFDSQKVTRTQCERYYDMIRREGNRKAALERTTYKDKTVLDLERLNMPVVIMWGRHDRWAPLEGGKFLSTRIPGSKLKIFDDVGHVPMEEMPTETVTEYLSFLGIQLEEDYFSAPKFFTHVY